MTGAGQASPAAVPAPGTDAPAGRPTSQPATPRPGDAAGGQPAAAPAAPAPDAVGEPAGDGRDAAPADARDLRTNDEDPTDHALSEQVVQAYYRVEDARMAGPTAFGSGATVVGTLNIGAAVAADKPFDTSTIDAVTIGEFTAGYVPTATDDELRSRLAGQPLVFLSGAEGTGRLTAALAALRERHTADRIAKIDLGLGTRLDEVVSLPRLLIAGHGHFLVADNRDAGIGTATAVAQLAAHADRLGATVLVVGRRDERYANQLSRYAVLHTGPEPAAVFRSRLERDLRGQQRCVGGCPECTGACIDWYVARCAEAIADDLNAMRALHEPVLLAAEFARQRPDPQRATTLLATSDTGLRAEARRFLRADDTPAAFGHQPTTRHQQAFRISYALLNGHPLANVFWATAALMDHFDEAIGQPRAGRDVLSLDIDALLGPGVREAATPVNAGTAHTARLRHPRLTEAVLDVAWNEYDTARQPLLAWLHGFARQQDPQIRMAGAAAVGWLCGNDFDQVFGRVVVPWAAEPSIAVRQAAALACEAAAYNGQLTERVVGTVHRWAHLMCPSRPKDTAARVYATTVGERFPDRALADLAVVATDPALQRLDSVARAVNRIYSPANAGAVLQELSRWSCSDRQPLVIQASRCLAMLAYRIADGSAGPWPQLLVDVHAGHLGAQPLAVLWRTALLHPATSNDAWRALGTWVACAEGHRDIGDAVAALSAVVFAEPVLRRRLRFYLTWFWRQRMPTNDFLDTVHTMVKGL